MLLGPAGAPRLTDLGLALDLEEACRLLPADAPLARRARELLDGAAR